jgi:hypothetical protein
MFWSEYYKLSTPASRADEGNGESWYPITAIHDEVEGE